MKNKTPKHNTPVKYFDILGQSGGSHGPLLGCCFAVFLGIFAVEGWGRFVLWVCSVKIYCVSVSLSGMLGQPTVEGTVC